MSQIKLFVATPMYGAVCHNSYALALADLSVACYKYEIPMKIHTINNDALIINARNVLAHEFLKTDFTHMLFIDADVGFSYKEALSLIQEDKDIIAGIYPKKTIDWARLEKAVKAGVSTNQLKYYTATHTFTIFGDTEVSMDTPLEVPTAPTGFMLIKRGVFEALQDKVDKYEHPDCDEKIDAFFDVEIADGKLYSEDNYFCRLWRSIGGKVYIAPWVCLPHTGNFSYQGKLTHI